MMKSVLALLLLFLLLFGLSPVLTVFNDDGTLRVIQQISDGPPFNGQPEEEMERIFAPNGPLQAAMTEYPRHYVAVFFTAFEEYLTRNAFAGGRRGQGDRLLVLLKDHQLLPEVYLPEAAQSVNVYFDTLYDVWVTYVDRTLLPSLGVFFPRRFPADRQVPVPPLLRPLLLTGERLEEEMGINLPTMRQGDLEQRFFDVYVGRYPTETSNRRRLYFVQGRPPRPRLRLAVLQAYYWMLVVRPFLYLVESNRRHYPRINTAQLTPTGDFDADQVVPAPAPAPVPVRRAHGGGGGGDRGPPANAPNPPADTFGDAETMRLIANYLRGEGIFVPTLFAVDRLYEEESALQRAMRARPTIYAAVLFMTFSVRIEAAFPGNEILQQDQFLVLLKDHNLLPVMYAGVGGPQNLPDDFTRFRHDLRLFQIGRLLFDDPALRGVFITAPEMGDVAVPPLFRPFFPVRGQAEPEMQPYLELWTRFLTIYVGQYPVEDEGRMEHYFAGNAENDARRGLLKALYWLLVVRPFQQMIEQHRRLFPGINPEELTPHDVRVDFGGRGGGGGPGGGPGGAGGGGHGGGNPPPPPAPRNPPPPPNPPPGGQGTCSARAVPVIVAPASANTAAPPIQPGRAGPAPKRSAPEDDDASLKKRKPDEPPKGPDGGGGAGVAG